MRKLDDACIFFLASLPKDVFETLRKIFDLYSKGNIKGQQVRKGALGMKLDLKGILIYCIIPVIIYVVFNWLTRAFNTIGSNFKPLRGLDAEVAHGLLKDVADKEMSMQEMMAECRDVKVLKEIQTKFKRNLSERLVFLHGKKPLKNFQNLSPQMLSMSLEGAISSPGVHQPGSQK